MPSAYISIDHFMQRIGIDAFFSTAFDSYRKLPVSVMLRILHDTD